MSVSLQRIWVERSRAARGDPDVTAPVPIGAVQCSSLPTASLLRRQQDQSWGVCARVRVSACECQAGVTGTQRGQVLNQGLPACRELPALCRLCKLPVLWSSTCLQRNVKKCHGCFDGPMQEFPSCCQWPVGLWQIGQSVCKRQREFCTMKQHLQCLCGSLWNCGWTN